MKIAAPYENGSIFQHFGQTGQFKMYCIKDRKVSSSEVVSTNGKSHGALAAFLSESGADTLICGGIGAGAKTAAEAEGLSIYAGVSGNADQAVNEFLSGSLIYDADSECTHHGDSHGGGCEDQDCSCSD